MEKEIGLLLKEKNVLPCALKFDLKGKIERNDHCLEVIPINKIKALKEEKIEVLEEMIEDDFEYKEFIGQTTDLPIYYNDVIFLSQINNIHIKKAKYSSKIIKKILYSYSVKKEDIILTKSLINEFTKLADKTCDDKEKAKTLDKIFKKTGYFIPLKVYVGGIYILKNENISIEEEKNLNNSINCINSDYKEEYNDNEKSEGSVTLKDKEDKAIIKSDQKAQLNDDFKKSYIKKNITIIGDESALRDYKRWENSLNISNAQVIDYDSPIYIYDFFDSDLKKKLEKPVEILEKKYEIRKSYIEKIKELQELKDNNIILKGDYKCYDWESGITKEMDKPKIYSKFFEKNSDGSWLGRIELTLKKQFEDVIVGYKITSRWRNGTNGWWELKENPILSKNISITFISQIFRGESFDITIYLMETPK